MNVNVWQNNITGEVSLLIPGSLFDERARSNESDATSGYKFQGLVVLPIQKIVTIPLKIPKKTFPATNIGKSIQIWFTADEVSVYMEQRGNGLTESLERSEVETLVKMLDEWLRETR